MKKAFMRLVRVKSDSLNGTFGVLKINEEWMCVTLEPPDKLNKSNVSCIPTGQYHCRGFNSGRFGRTWIVENVPGRSFILFHPGNLIPDTKGCVLVAEHFGKLGEKHAVLNSGVTFKKFMDYLNDYEIASLTVSESF